MVDSGPPVSLRRRRDSWKPSASSQAGFPTTTSTMPLTPAARPSDPDGRGYGGSGWSGSIHFSGGSGCGLGSCRWTGRTGGEPFECRRAGRNSGARRIAGCGRTIGSCMSASAFVLMGLMAARSCESIWNALLRLRDALLRVGCAVTPPLRIATGGSHRCLSASGLARRLRAARTASRCPTRSRPTCTLTTCAARRRERRECEASARQRTSLWPAFRARFPRAASHGPMRRRLISRNTEPQL